jgi:two-component system, LytTR family, sensor histidine kinase AgrC
MNFLYTFFFESVPEAWITIYFSCCLLKPSLTENKRGLFFYAILTELFCDFFHLWYPEMELSSLVIFVVSLLLIRFVLKVNWALAISLKVTSFLVEIIGEMLIIYLVTTWFSITPEEIISNLKLKIGLPLCYLIPTLLISYYLKKKKIVYSFSVWRKGRNKWLLPLIILQLIFGLMFHFLFFLQEEGYTPAFSSYLIHFPVLTLLMFGVTFVILIYLRKTHREEIQESILATEQPLIEQIEKMIHQWRSYRHDLHHHIEVLQTLLQEKKFAEAQTYMSAIHQEIISTQQIYPFRQPVINALLQSKAVQAEQHQIQFCVQSEEAFLFPRLKSYDLVRILGNILDNAIDAVAASKQNVKEISVHYQKILGINVLNVTNNGPYLSKDEQQKVFEAGYTTKLNSHHQGSGLATVHHLVKEYDGEISILSNEQQTSFQIAIPDK